MTGSVSRHLLQGGELVLRRGDQRARQARLGEPPRTAREGRLPLIAAAGLPQDPHGTTLIA